MIKPISDILESLPVKGRVKEYSLWKVWERLVGRQVSMHCQPERLNDGILFLKVTSNVWMQQLHFMKSMIIDKVNGHLGGHLGDSAVKDIRFRLGKVEYARKYTGRPWKDVTLGKGELSVIDKDLSSVRDPELREAIRKVRLKEAQVKAWRDQRDKGGSSKTSPE